MHLNSTQSGVSSLEVQMNELARALSDETSREGNIDFPTEAFQRLFSELVKAYSLHSFQVGRDAQPDPFDPSSGVSATDVVITVAAMLRSHEIAAFELAMWYQ